MKALTVFPEHAELFRLGIRTIETRRNRTSHRGLLAIRASQRDPDSAAARRDPIGSAAMGAIPHGDPLSLGAITAVADLAFCVPILHAEAELATPWVRHVAENHRGRLWYWRGEDDYAPTPGWKIEDVEAQRHYGDFTPGRWAWILRDVQPLAEPVPSPCLPGMFDLRPDVEAAVRAQLREVVAS